MPASLYRMYLDNQPASHAQLDQVEEITVEQEVDMAWEARLQIPICTDAQGKWMGADANFLASFTRLRLEIKVGDGAFVPLIDGPIVGSDSQMSSEPGQSVITVIVHDDSVYLHRQDKINPYENKLDHEIAADLFRSIEQVAVQDIETTPAPSDGLPPFVMQRGTQMDLLRRLAQRQGMHAYVLPGVEPGQSIGAFKKLPTRPDGLPPLILLGPDRNVATFTVTNDAQSPASFEAYTLNITDKVVTRATSKFRDLELLGEEVGFENEADTATRLLPLCGNGVVQAHQAVAAAMEKAAFSFAASGSVLADCYTGVLAPYRVVTVKGVNERLSGDYVIKQVTHTLTRSRYTQAFSLLRNARSAGGGLEDLAGTIF
jgi:hypothetical protein